MFINKKDKFSIRKLKNGTGSVKIGTVALLLGATVALTSVTSNVEAAMTENSDNTTTISNDKGSVVVDTANIENPNEGKQFSTDPTAEGTNTITKTGKVDYKYVTAEGNTVLEENKNQNSGADKTIETTYNVYGKSGEVFKETTGGDAQDSDLNDAKENGKKETIEKDGKTYHLIGEPKVENTGNGGGVYSDTTLGDVTAKLTPEGLSNSEGKITYDNVKAGGKAWIVEQTGKGTYGKYVQADSGAITSDAKMVEAFKAGEAAAKDFTSANVTTDGGIKEGDYVFVLEKNTYVTAKSESFSLTAQIQLSYSDNVANGKDGTGATLNRTYAMVQNFKAAPDTLTGEANKTLVKNYLSYLQEKGFEDNLLNFKRYITLGIEAKSPEHNPLAISADKGDQVDDKGRPTTDIKADIESVTNQETSTIDDTNDFLLKFSDPMPEVEEYSYRDEITPLRAYRLASGTTTITYTYAEEKTREVEKKGSVVVNYQTEDGTELKAPYTDTAETVAEVVTEKYYVDADGQEVVVEDKTDRTPKNVAYNTKENETEKPQKLTDAAGNVYYLNEANTKTAVNDQETTSPAETGTVVEGVTKVTYIYEKAGSVIVNYKTEDGTALTGTVVGDESKTVESGAKDVDNGKPGTAYNTADNGMKPERIKTAEGKVYQLVPDSTEGEEEGTVVAGETKEVTYVYEKAGQVVVHYTDEKGNTIQADAVDTKDGKPNSDYNTADNGMKPNRITTPEGKVYELIPQSTKGDETGKVKAGETTEVTYVYKEITGNVVVHYVDTEGNTLAEDTKDVENGSLSEKYDTTDNKPAKLEKAGQVYYLTAKELKDGSKPENGAVVEGTTEITYVYEKAGNVLVHYVDEAGNTLQADAVDTKDGQPGAKYDTSDKDMKPTRITTPEGKVYELVPASTKGNETGDVEAGKTTEVTYVYKEVKGNVVVHYTDEAGNTIAEDVKDTTDGSVSSAYDTSDNKPATITTKDGKVYVLVPTSTKGEESGKVTEGTTEVTYVYKEVTGDVVVHYVDTEGNVIAEDKEDTKGASLNAKYDTTDNKPATIEKDGVKYYLTEKAVKDDSKPETGDVVEGKTEVTYVYEKAGQVVVHYVDEAGNTIQTDAVDTKDGKPGVAYNTTDNDMKPTRITTAEGRVYELVPASTKGNENGSVEAGKTTEVTYVYKEVKGNVVVHYVDEAGNTIAEDVKDTTDGSVSSAYDTSDNKPATITTKDGKLYVLVPTSTKGDENGKVTEGTTEVTYVYKEVKEGTTNGGSLTPSQPGSPSTPSTNPTSPVKPTEPSQPTTPANPATPTMPSAPVNGKAPQAPVAPSEAKGQAELPNTGTEDHASLAALGLLGVLSGFGLVARKKKED